MKKYRVMLSVLLGFLLILTGCGGSDSTSSSGADEKAIEQSTEAMKQETDEAEAQEGDTDAGDTQEDTAPAEPIILADDDLITFQVTGMEPYESGDYAVWYDMSLTNNSDKEVLVSSVGDSFKVNGVYVGEIVNGIMETIAPGETVNPLLSIRIGLNDKYNYELPENNDFKGAEISGKVSVYDNADTSIKLGSYSFKYACE